MTGLLLVNPRSGDARPGPDELARAARDLDLEVHVLAPADDPADIARSADADILGIAGGDGSLGAVAHVAVERGAQFVCVPFGTRNHFARDIGLDRNDPLAALSAFSDGVERRVDVGRLGDQVFLNNVSVGLYASLVERRERHRRRGALFARLRALRLSARDRRPAQLTVDGVAVAVRVLLVANNEYRLDPASFGERSRLDAGTLHLYLAKGLLPFHWETLAPRTTAVIDSESAELTAAIDGEALSLHPPVHVSIEPQGLRLLVPRRR